jgi:glycosyltransferase involved in cell wall biosynthesis
MSEPVAANAGANGMIGGDAQARPIKASVLVMTYNHAKFIAQAIDSVLMQRTTFAYEVIISEDCSTDGTREIVMGYQRRYPDKVRLLLSERNLHSLAVVSRGIRACRGEFVALLDGDDYWIDPEKLQRQSEFLDSHPDCSTCFHNATAVYEDASRGPVNWTPPQQKDFMTLKDIWRGNPIATGSTVFRSGLYELPPWYDEMPLTDWPLHVLNAEHGTIGYIDRVMSVYRIHRGGDYSRLDETSKLEKQHQFYVQMNKNMHYRCDSLAKNGLFYYFLEWAEEFKNRGDRENARLCVRRCLSGRPLRRTAYLRLYPILKWLLGRAAADALSSAQRAPQ